MRAWSGIVFALAVVMAFGQGKAPAAESILGIRLGMKLEEARTRLKDAGTPGGHETRRGGYLEAWTLPKGEYASVAYRTDDEKRIVWISGFLRPGQEVPFEKIGDLGKASSKAPNVAIWNFIADDEQVRVVAKGPGGKARVIYVLSSQGDD